jgi:hypothetical protein
MKAYKVFNPDFTCRGFQFEVGKTYTHKGEISMCKQGFHACKKVADCFNCYSFDPKNKVAEVDLLGKVLGDDDKQVTDKIKIIRELTWQEVLVLANVGLNNTGHSNSGNRNSGHGNSGHSNSGHWNSGHWNSGYSNSGDSNSGDWNSGDSNSGCFNSITPDEILAFNKPCKRKKWDNAEKPRFIHFNLCVWIRWEDMSEAEKAGNKAASVTEGYLKKIGYKEAWAAAYANASEDDISLLKALPNFDPKVFREITGIDVDKPSKEPK